eukprot:15433523-Alexandrium_andersonii.AAC.1
MPEDARVAAEPPSASPAASAPPSSRESEAAEPPPAPRPRRQLSRRTLRGLGPRSPGRSAGRVEPLQLPMPQPGPPSTGATPPS